jgi:hypothetical protein
LAFLSLLFLLGQQFYQRHDLVDFVCLVNFVKDDGSRFVGKQLHSRSLEWAARVAGSSLGVQELAQISNIVLSFLWCESRLLLLFLKSLEANIFQDAVNQWLIFFHWGNFALGDGLDLLRDQLLTVDTDVLEKNVTDESILALLL